MTEDSGWAGRGQPGSGSQSTCAGHQCVPTFHLPLTHPSPPPMSLAWPTLASHAPLYLVRPWLSWAPRFSQGCSVSSPWKARHCSGLMRRPLHPPVCTIPSGAPTRQDHAGRLFLSAISLLPRCKLREGRLCFPSPTVSWPQALAAVQRSLMSRPLNHSAAPPGEYTA